MMLKAIPRTALDRSIKLIRLPADAVLGLAGDTRTAGTVKLGLDRVEAAVRAGAGSVLRDETLQRDAERRRSAADERERASVLRAEAEARAEAAQSQADTREQQADKRRRRAAEAAKRKRAAAEKRRKATTSSAAKAARSRSSTAQKTAAEKKKEAEERSKRERLEQIDTQRDALHEKEAALTTTEEAERLGDAAAAAKAERKS